MRCPLVLFAFLIAAAAAGCTRTEVATEPPAAAPVTDAGVPPEPAGVVARLDEHRWLGAPVVAANLTVWPVVTDAPQDVGEFLTLEEAEKLGVAKVTEIGAAAQPAQAARITRGSAPAMGAPPPAPTDSAASRGSEPPAQTLDVQTSEGGALAFSLGDEVNALMVSNTGDLPLLLCAGTIVRGGNQDRQIGEDVVVAAHSTRRIDVFCVEQGRWEANRLGEATNAVFGASGVVASKSVRLSAQYMKSQAEVWEQVAAIPEADVRIAEAGGAGGRTTYLRNVENAAKETTEARERTAAAVREHFASARAAGSHVVGFAYAVNGKPVNVRAFAAPKVFEKQFAPFLQAMVIDAEVARSEGAGPEAKAADVVALVETIRSGRTSDEMRAGYRLRIVKGDAGFNSNCYFMDAGAASSPAAPRAAADLPITEDWTAR